MLHAGSRPKRVLARCGVAQVAVTSGALARKFDIALSSACLLPAHGSLHREWPRAPRSIAGVAADHAALPSVVTVEARLVANVPGGPGVRGLWHGSLRGSGRRRLCGGGRLCGNDGLRDGGPGPHADERRQPDRHSADQPDARTDSWDAMTHEDSHPANHRFCTSLPLVTRQAGRLPLLRPQRSVVGSPQWDLFKTAQRKRLPQALIISRGDFCEGVMRDSIAGLCVPATSDHAPSAGRSWCRHGRVNHYCMVLTRAFLAAAGATLGAPLKQLERALRMSLCSTESSIRHTARRSRSRP